MWTNPSQQLLAETLKQYSKEDFSTFEVMFDQMIAAIKRRNAIEKNIENTPLIKNVLASEFKDLTWADSPDALSDRLLRIKSLQLQTAEKINLESKDQFMQRLAKRRLKHESDFTDCSSTEKQQLILSYVLKATSSALDSQTLYFTPTEAGHFMMQVQQKLFGIGAQLRDDLVGFSIMHLVEGSPASQANKLKIGDRIIAVDNEPVVGMDIVEAVELIDVSRLGVGNLRVKRDQFRHVGELGERCHFLEGATIGRQFHIVDGATERRGPSIEGIEATLPQPVQLQVALHRPEFGHGVGHRR
ncbi:MAG: PDZ domain-containing protein, partial [Chlamydiota bacterium]